MGMTRPMFAVQQEAPELKPAADSSASALRCKYKAQRQAQCE
jgi:hypothetical protein